MKKSIWTLIVLCLITCTLSACDLGAERWHDPVTGSPEFELNPLDVDLDGYDWTWGDEVFLPENMEYPDADYPNGYIASAQPDEYTVVIFLASNLQVLGGYDTTDLAEMIESGPIDNLHVVEYSTTIIVEYYDESGPMEIDENLREYIETRAATRVNVWHYN